MDRTNVIVGTPVQYHPRKWENLGQAALPAVANSDGSVVNLIVFTPTGNVYRENVVHISSIGGDKDERAAWEHLQAVAAGAQAEAPAQD